MGNIPGKITGKYQSYDINTPSHSTPPIPTRKQESLEYNPSKMEFAEPIAEVRSSNQPSVNSNQKQNPLLNIDIYQEEKQTGFHETFNEMESNHSNRNSVYNEQPVDVSSDYRADTSENEDYIEHHVNNRMETVPRQIDVMY